MKALLQWSISTSPECIKYVGRKSTSPQKFWSLKDFKANDGYITPKFKLLRTAASSSLQGQTNMLAE